MNHFAALLDQLALEPSRNNKLRLLAHYFRATPDPDRGLALAAMTGALTVASLRPAAVRALIAERVDPQLFALSYDFVGDLSETVALMWPVDPARHHNRAPSPSLSVIVESLRRAGKRDAPALLAGFLDDLDETGRWALLKLLTGALRIGVSARLAKTAVAALGDVGVEAIEEVWHGLAPPYVDLFAWAEGRGPRPVSDDPAPFRAPMLAHALTSDDIETLDPRDYVAEWKWDGVRVQASVVARADGARVARLYSRAGEDMSGAFPDMIEALLASPFANVILDGELLVRDGDAIRPFADLQQRLNRKAPTAKMLREFPPLLRVYDLLLDGGEDIRATPFAERRARLETLMRQDAGAAFDLSPLVPFASFDELARARRAGPPATEGVMLKRADSIYVTGRPKGPWWKWKREPYNVDAVLMYAQRGHGKRASLYSDFTFGVWRGGDLLPVGKAYFGFTDAELSQLDKWVRENTINRFGPVREVAHGADDGLVLEIAFEGLNRSTRHKSGLAMRFPRIARIRWDKKAGEADVIAALEALLPAPAVQPP